MTAKAASNTPPSVKIKIVTICSPNSISKKSLVGVQRIICSPKDDMAGVPAMPAITMTAFTYHRSAARRRPLEADLVNPLSENFHREALSVPLAHAAVLMAEYRSANINGALISP